MTNPFDEDRPPRPPRRGGGRRRRGGRGRGDPDSMVPEAEFTSYYGRPVVKPVPWGHEIAAYLFLGGLAGGSGLIGAGAHATGRETLRRNARWSAIAAVSLGGAALVADLGRPERFVNMMRTVKLTSPMSVGSWILTAFAGSAGVALAAEVARRFVPDRPGRDAVARSLLSAVDAVGSAGSAAFAAPLAAYTAVLLADTSSPTWHESFRELPFVFVSSGNAAAAGLAMVVTPTAETGPVRVLAVLASGLDLGADALLEHRLGELARPLHEGRAGRLGVAAKVLTAAGAAGAALLGGHRAGAVVSGLALMAGSACTRFSVFEAGIESAKDPAYTMGPQRARFDEKARRGAGITQPGRREE